MAAKPFSLLKFPQANEDTVNVVRRPARVKGIENHLSICERIGVSRKDILAPLLGYCPGRPPKHGAMALTPSCVMFCQKTKLGDSLTDIHLSQISAVQAARLLKQTLITIHSPGLAFQFATRMPQDDIMYFISLLRIRIKNQSWMY